MLSLVLYLSKTAKLKKELGQKRLVIEGDRVGLEDGPASKDLAHNHKDLSLDSQYLCLIQLKQKQTT